MLSRFAVCVVDFCRRFALFVVLIALTSIGGLGVYIADHFRMNTNVDDLLGDGLAWRDLETQLAEAFPQNSDRLVIVIDGKTADAAEDAADALAAALKKKRDLFKTVSRPDDILFFRKNGLLFLSKEELASTLDTLVKAQPFLGSLARDPSLRGLMGTLALSAEGVRRGEADVKSLEPSFDLMAGSVSSALAGQAEQLPWRSMMASEVPKLRDLRKFILTQPVLDFSALSPGHKATKEVRRLAQELGLTPDRGVSVRLTGSVALNDEEFASVANGMEFALFLSLLLVVSLLYLALRSARLILPIALTLVTGLIATTAFALWAIGSLNLISVAFAVMFIGIAVDFGIQFGVKFREERHVDPDIVRALRETAAKIAPPLAFAAAATTLGFLAFIPTDYRGVSELGLIAAAGMVFALILNLTLLPALLALFKPPAEPEAIGYSWAAPIDRFLMEKRKTLLYVLGAVALVAAPIAAQTRFDFDPLNLKDPKTESVQTMFSVMEDPDATPYTIQILSPNLEEAKDLAAKIDALPEVDHTITLASFVPKDQAEKLAFIDDAKFILGPTLSPPAPLPAPTDEENIRALRETATQLRSLSASRAAANLALLLDRAAEKASPDLLKEIRIALVDGLVSTIHRIQVLLNAETVTQENIPEDLRRDWMTPDGRAKIEVYPKGNARDHKTLEAFTAAVRKLAPDAAGVPISIQESGRTVLNAFIKAGLLALAAIGLLAFAILRRISDVLRLLTPLILAGILTLASMVLIGLPLTFANIIALPLLLSLGVSYAIYFVTYWRSGKENPLSSSMARAVLFSAATTLVAFGSLSLSSHKGTQGMGELLTLALLYSLISTFLALPVLQGRAR